MLLEGDPEIYRKRSAGSSAKAPIYDLLSLRFQFLALLEDAIDPNHVLYVHIQDPCDDIRYWINKEA